MTVLTVGREASAVVAHAVSYARHRPEQTLLYQLVQTHYPAFLVELAARDGWRRARRCWSTRCCCACPFVNEC